MKSSEVRKKTLNATKWSSITEVTAKIVSPIINMILARILAPEAFGVLTTVTMVVSFAEVFVDSGFQKFLIQHEFKDDREQNEYTSVAFWTNLIFSLIIWIIIIVFRDQIATLVGNEGLGNVLAIAGAMIPVHAIIGIQNCIIRKRLEFKKLFFVRIPAALVPLVVTLPLALLGFDYWSLVIGSMSGCVVRSILLAIVGGYRPQIFFNGGQLKHMMKFGYITLLDGLVIWSTSWVDSLLITNTMTSYQLGLYKNSIGIITTLFHIVTASVTPVLYSGLSKLQKDDRAFNELFTGAQKILCMILLPMGVGMFLYRDLATEIILGSKWSEASFIIGITAITLALRTIFISFNSDAYRAKGKFYIPLILQIADLAILIPTCLISANVGFETLVYARAIARLDVVIPGFILLYTVCKIRFADTVKNLLPNFISVTIMSCLALLLQKVSSSMVWSFFSILCCAFVYFGVLCIFKKERKAITEFFKNIIKKAQRKATKI